MKDFKVYASCHNHSTYSDADYSPEKLADLALSLGHGGIILTDHDTVKGTYFMNKAARRLGLKSMLGCEFSTYHKGKGVHLLGFDFDPDNSEMKKIIRYGASVQTERSRTMFEWGQERGTLRRGIVWEDVLDDHPNHDFFCNNQIFDSFLKRGIYKEEEFKEFQKLNFSYNLGLEAQIREATGKSYKDINTADVVKAILNAGGVPVVAHPHGVARFAEDFIDMGVLGFETRYPECAKESPDGIDEHEFYEKLCDEKKLYKMGGSDHSGVLGGYGIGDVEYRFSGISEEDFMRIYERRLG